MATTQVQRVVYGGGTWLILECGHWHQWEASGSQTQVDAEAATRVRSLCDTAIGTSDKVRIADLQAIVGSDIPNVADAFDCPRCAAA